MNRTPTLHYPVQKTMLIITFFMVIFPYWVFSQNKIDSLSALIEKEVTEEKKIPLIVERAKFYPATDFDKAMEEISVAASYYENNSDKKGLSDVHFARAVLYDKINRRSDALVEDSIAITLAKKVSYMDKYAEILGHQGILYAKSLDYPNAIKSLREAMQHETDMVKIARLYNTLGIVNKNMGEVFSSISLLDSGITIMENMEMDESLYQNLLMNKGNALSSVSRFDEAYSVQLKSLRIKEKLKDTFGIAQSYNNIAVDFKNQKEYEKSIEYYRKAIDLTKDMKYSTLAGMCYMNLGILYDDLDILDSAQFNYQRAVAFYENIDDTKGLVLSYLNYGNYLIKIGQHEQAESYIDKGIQIGEKSTSPDILGTLLVNKAILYLDQNDLKSAENALNEAATLLHESGNNGRKKNLYGTYVDFYEKKGDYQNAVNYLKLYHEISNTISSEDNRIELLTATNQYDYEKRELEFALDQQKEKEKQSRIILVAVASILLLLALYIVLLSRRKRIKTRHQAALIQLEQQHRIDSAQSLREAEEEERKKIANKLHDEVGALLSIAKLNVDQLEEDVFVADSDATNKIQTAGKLLGEVAESVRNISHTLMPVALEKYGLKSAIHDLTSSLQASGKIKVEEVIEGLEDTAAWPKDFVLGVYRIVQEALNNVIKHAEASHILIQLVELDDAVTIYIEDNGRGIPAEDVAEGLGMRLLQRNVEYFNGTIEINGNPSDGTFILVELKKGWI